MAARRTDAMRGSKKLDGSELKPTVCTALTPLRNIPCLFDSFSVNEPGVTEPAFQVSAGFSALSLIPIGESIDRGLQINQK
jgi:hypothetical protein